MLSVLTFLSSDEFMPHGHCYLWKPGMVWLQVVTNGLIGLAYLVISLTLVYLVRKGEYLPFKGTAIAFGTFIVSCGVTHFFDIYVIWNPAYWVDGSIRAVTALASVGTAILLPPLVPKAITLARGAKAAHDRGMELEAAVDELGRMYEKARELDRLKTQFFANVSHELRTPLALILGPLDQLSESTRLSSEEHRNVDVAARNARTLLRHVNHLLEGARLDAGHVRPEYARVDVVRLVRRMASLFEAAARDHGISFTLQLPEKLEADADSDKLQRVVLNLLSNAFKFTPANGRIRVTLGTFANEHEQLMLDVADSGPGVPPKDRSVIFQRFRQGDDTATRKQGGIGLGLAICNDFVALHGGSIEVTTAAEGGALFRVVLPRYAPADTSVVSENEDEPKLADERDVRAELDSIRTPDAQALAADAADAPHVLVVEDNPEMASFITSLLRPQYRTTHASDGRKGLELALDLRPDLVLADVMMPELSGDDLVRVLRSRRELDASAIMVLTAKTDDRLRERLLAEGAQDYLTKPFSAGELRARTANLITAKRARDVLQRELDSHTHDLSVLAAEAAQRKRELQTALDSARVAREHAERASQLKTNFLSLVSHELRTPLSALLLQIERLRMEAGDVLGARLANLLQRMDQSARRLQALIESLLHYARIQSGRLTVRYESFDPAALIAETVEELRSQAESKGLELTLECKDGVSEVHTDPQLLRLIAVNLVGNAVKFTERGGVRVTLESDGLLHRLDVSDTGPGIPAEAMPRIFEPFEQGEPTRQKHASGAGLGLTIVKEMATALGARIMVESDTDHGTTFTVLLPTQPTNGSGA